ncbi:Hypothetical protein D9617_6g095920 [Elsinoe fawcettii]|nr:Hypothetical protein D9617_6g095920 [Elsinoe fawcettii]
MPHKHTRRAGGPSDKDFDLPPTSRAKPLAVGKKSGTTELKGKKRKRGNEDDTPREFKRLMELQKHMSNKKSGGVPKARIDREDVPRQKKNRAAPLKKGSEETAIKVEEEAVDGSHEDKDVKKAEKPKRSNGLCDPAWGVRGPLDKDVPALKEKSSRLQRKIEKKVATWRNEDERLRKKREDDIAKYREQEEERIATLLEKSGMSSSVMDDPDVLKQLGLDDEADEVAEKEIMAKRGKKKRRGKEEDDFAVLKDKREKPKGLHDVAKAPPELKKLKDRFKAQRPGTIAGGEGGLKRKADLSEARQEVIRRYREMMARKREQ